MEKITKEELMQKMNLSEDELVKITGGNIEDIKAFFAEKCQEAKDRTSNKCREDYVIDRDYDKLWKCEAEATEAYYKCMSNLDRIQ